MRKKDVLASERELYLMKVTTPPVIKRLFWYGAVCSGPSSADNNNKKSLNTQEVTQQELPKYKVERNTTYHIGSRKKELNKKLFAKADSLVDKILSCPRIKLSNSQTLKLDGVETGVSLSDFGQQLRRKNADVSEIYFILLDAAGMSPTLAMNQNASAKERRSWVPFKVWTSEAIKVVHAGRCCLWYCTHISGN